MNAWFEQLPERCPDSDARHPEGEVYYRLVESELIRCEDFWSHKKRWPHRAFGASECTSRAVSVFRNLASCEHLLLLPVHSRKKIAQVRLPSEAGVVKRTFNTSGHYSWWRSSAFDPVANSMIIKSGIRSDA